MLDANLPLLDGKRKKLRRKKSFFAHKTSGSGRNKLSTFYNERILCFHIFFFFRSGRRRKRTFPPCVGGCFIDIEIFFSSLLLFDIPHKISFITFLLYRKKETFLHKTAKFVSFFFLPFSLYSTL